MPNTKEQLANIAKQEKQFDAMYRSIGSAFGLPDCAMWVLYYLSNSDEEITQQRLTELMMFPKQTINSAVMTLSNKDFVELQTIIGTRNKKKISLTKTGADFSKQTVVRMYEAECRAAKAIGEKKMSEFNELYAAFFTALENEFKKEGLIHE